jgi:hypothetical protein
MEKGVTCVHPRNQNPCCRKHSPLYPLKGPSIISVITASSATAAGMTGEPNNAADAMTAADRRATAEAGALLLDSAGTACTVTLRDLSQLDVAALLLCNFECNCIIVPATAADDLVCGYTSRVLVRTANSRSLKQAVHGCDEAVVICVRMSIRHHDPMWVLCESVSCYSLARAWQSSYRFARAFHACFECNIHKKPRVTMLFFFVDWERALVDHSWSGCDEYACCSCQN